jgi:tryptophan synthase alpha chain
MRKVFDKKSRDLLSIFLTAGYPDHERCEEALLALQIAGVDLIELGMPYSDPLADGPVIQEANQQALGNGITMDKYFELVEKVRGGIDCPIIFMGYFNNVLQYGVEPFLKKCQDTGIDSLIIPDLPPEIFERMYVSLFQAYGLGINCMICPTSDADSIRLADRLSHQFIYQVASSTITGRSTNGSDTSTAFLERIAGMTLEHNRLIGFGISDHAAFSRACRYSSGGIIGSAFIRLLQQDGDMRKNIIQFIHDLRGSA